METAISSVIGPYPAILQIVRLPTHANSPTAFMKAILEGGH